MRFGTKKKLAVVAVAAITLISGIAAYAYFTGGSDSDTKSAAVGSNAAWDIVLGAFSGGPVYPDAGSQSATYTITNVGDGDQALTGVSAAVVANSGNITQAGVPLAGCLATWFTATAGAPTPGVGTSIADNGTATGSVSLTMQDFPTNQNVCKGATPDVIVTAS